MEKKIIQHFKGQITFKIIKSLEQTIICLGSFKYELIEQQPKIFVLMIPYKGKIKDYKGDYEDVLKETLDFIFDDITSRLKSSFNLEITEEL